MSDKKKTRSVLSDSDKRDLDETRRLAYMLLVRVDDKKYRELVATLVNAIVHHQQSADAAEAMDHIAALANNPDDEDARRWLNAHVARITKKLRKHS